MSEAMTVNVDLLRQAVEWVEREDAKPWFDSQWNQSGVIGFGADVERNCDTCFCVAGYVASVVRPDAFGSAETYYKFFESAIEVAEKALGLPLYTGLFKGDNTAADVRRIAEELAGCPL